MEEYEFCECETCLQSDNPCQMDCEDNESMCVGCWEDKESASDREFDEKVALGYFQ